MKNCLRTLLLLLCSTVASANNPVVPADETYTLTYVVDGEDYAIFNLAAGAAINLPAGPVKQNYVFVGWRKEAIDIASNADAMLYTNAPCTDTRYGDQFTSWQVLFDGDETTIFHSEYANKESADGLDHYLRVDMGEGKSITNFTFTYTNRNTNSYINAPKTMVVEGSNSANGNYDELVVLTNLPSLNYAVYTSEEIGNGTAYRYIRYRVTETHGGRTVYEHPYFHIAEFGMSDATIPTTMPASDISLVAVYKQTAGICGESATWSFTDGVLTISGTGAMENYSYASTPWYKYREDITAVIIENGVTSICDYAFYNCTSITSITIPNSVTSIGNHAFSYCTGLTSVIIPGSVTTIGSNAFQDCNNLENIISLATTPATLGGDVFNGIGENAVLKVPANAKDAYEASEAWSVISTIETICGTCGENLTWVLNYGVLTIIGTGDMANYSDTGDNTAPWTEYREDITTVVIEDGVTSIGDWAFNECSGLTSVTIPGSVTSIGGYAFQNCSSLTSIYIPANVTSIGISFNYCSLKSIVVDEENSVYDSREGCNAIIETATNTLIVGSENTIIPNSVTSIGSCAFGGRNGLASITIPNSVTSIRDYAFGDCYDLTSVTIGKNVTHIEGQAFYRCTGLASIVVDEGNSVYDSREGCNAIIKTETNTLIKGCKNSTIPGSVTSIEGGAFQDCNSLTSIEIPNSVSSIGYGAFRDCTGLTSIVVDEENSVYDSREGCNAIIETATNTLIQGCMNTIIPNSVTTIGDYAFYNCSGLTSVTIPNSVTSIGSWVFYNCDGLTSMEIPSSVTEVGFNAFSGCSNLTDIYLASNPTLGVTPFPSTATCHLTLTDSDAADFNTANANTYSDVSYTRTISEGKYGTIMLPFVPDEASLQNYAFYTLKEAGDGYIRFEEVATPEANTPYLYTLRAGGENVAITGGETTIAADINNCNVDGWEFVGSFTNQTIDCTDGNYYAYSAARNEINRITKTLTVSPYRAYLKSTAAQNSNLRVFIGGTTGVTEISPDDIEGFNNGAVYDLYGRPVNEPAKGGIYIIDGKKVVW